jgi:hypothetical protein
MSPVGGSAERSVLGGLIALARRIVKISVFSSPDEVIKYLKGLSDDCRVAAIRGGPAPKLVRLMGVRTRRAIEQCSYLGRSLPHGGDRAVRKSLENHQRNLNEKFETSPELLSKARSFAAVLGGRRKAAPPGVGDLPLTGGACLEKSRKEGGLASFLVEARWQMGESPYCPETLEGVSLEQAMSLSADAALRDWLFLSLPELPEARVLSIKERGGKARIVTKSPGALVALAHIGRKEALRALRTHPAAALTLRGDLPTQMRGVGQVVSADLETASDLIPHDLARAMWEGFCDGAGLSDELRHVGFLSLGPQRVTWPNGDTSVTSRGILMGLPLTWVVLSMVQIFCAEEALRQAWQLNSREQPPSSLQPFFVCGDDLIAVWTTGATRCYERIMAECGLRFSKGKHLISPNKGVFLEKILVFERRRRFEARGPLTRTLADFFPLEEQWLIELVKVSQAFPLKGLVSPSFPPGAEKSLPSWWSAGATSWELAKHTGPRRVSMVQRVVKDYSRLGHLGLYRPRSLGGLGLLPPRGSRTPLKRVCSRRFRKAAAILATGSNQDISDLRSAWTLSVPGGWRLLATADAESDFTAHSYRVARRGKPVNPTWVALSIAPDQYRERMIGFSCRSYTFMMGVEPGTLKVCDLAKAIRRRLSKVLLRWRSVKAASWSIGGFEERLANAGQDLVVYATPLPPPYYEGPAPPIAAIGWEHHGQAQRKIPLALGWSTFLREGW